MVKASAYTLEELLESLDEAYGEFIDGRYGEYERVVKLAKERLDKLVEKYTEDSELLDYRAHFRRFFKEMGGVERDEEKEKLVWIKSELNNIVHWRKLGMSAGRVLPFSDYRSKRGSIGGR